MYCGLAATIKNVCEVSRHFIGFLKVLTVSANLFPFKRAKTSTSYEKLNKFRKKQEKEVKNPNFALHNLRTKKLFKRHLKMTQRKFFAIVVLEVFSCKIKFCGISGRKFCYLSFVVLLGKTQF